MNKLIKVSFLVASIGMIFSCQTTTNNKEADEKLTPVEEDDKQRYNINEADQEVLKLDSAANDTSFRDTILN